MTKSKVLNRLTDIGAYIAGCGIYSVAVVMFITPAKMSPGGVTGIATVFDFLTGVPAGVTVFILNIPLLIIALLRLGKVFLLNTGIATVLMSIELTVAEQFVKPYVVDNILSAVFGGIMMGFGLGLVFLRSATTGGFDIIIKLVNIKYPYITVGRLYLLLDVAVIALSAICYRYFQSALYSALCIFISSKTMDYIVYGSGGGKLILAVTVKKKEVADAIMNTISRGVTCIEATGGFTGDTRNVLMCAVARHQAARVLDIIKQSDPNSFSVITDATEIAGLGFKR